MLSHLLNDVRYSLRGFARRPAFAAVVVVTLALAIGLNVAVFSIFDQLMLRTLPVADPAGLVNFVGAGERPGAQLGGPQGDDDEIFSYPMFLDLERAIAAGSGPLTGIAASRLAGTSLGFAQRTAPGQVLLVSGRYFSLLGVGPALGRMLGPQDIGEPGTAAAAVLSYDYWQSTLGAPADVIGKTLNVGGTALEIVGVAPRGFEGTTPGRRPSAFVPITFEWFKVPGIPPLHPQRSSYWVYIFGRLAPGATLEEAQASINVPYRAAINEIEAPATRLEGDRLEKFRAKVIDLEQGAQGQSMAPRMARAPLAILFAATATILLIGCMNLASLMLARGAGRIAEMAVRASLGAGRRRLVVLLTVEALLLAGVAAVASLPIELAVLHGVAAWAPAGTIVVPDLSLSLRSLAAAFAIAGGAIILFALVPLLKLTRTDPGVVLQASGAGRSFGAKGTGKLRFALSTAQISMSMLLLVLAALFAQSLANVARVDLGIRTELLVAFTVAPSLNGYPPARTEQLFDRIEQELRVQPGVTDVTSSMITLLADQSFGATDLRVEGYEGPEVRTNFNVVGGDYLRTLGVPLLAGRELTEADTAGAPKVAIVNEAFARQYGLGPNPLGKRVGIDTRVPPNIEIVGLFKDTAYNRVKDAFKAQLVMPRRQDSQFGSRQMTFYARAAQTPEPLLAAIPRMVAAIDPDVAITDVRTLDSQARQNVRTDWLLMALAGTLAAVATLLAALGLYGVLSYGVAQRTREIGLRLALGAAPARVRRMVLGQVAWMAGIGVPLGLVGALLVGRLAAALLFGLAPTDPLAFGAAGVLLAAVVLGASYVPARRASRVDPMVALRTE
ncbi:MAG TPA: ABC transporter permease [Gammaproteobacteria bacterium]|nr:ABC transporter permease [Gammaproteobacteria bacterium]